jgi:hypothetical protein
LKIAPSPSREPSVATNGSEFLVIWSGDRSLRARRISREGNFLDGGEEGVLLTRGGARPHILWDGTRYVATWGTGYPGGDIRAAFIGTGAGVMPERIETVSRTADQKQTPFVVLDASGRALIGFERYASEQPHLGTRRIFTKFMLEGHRARVRRTQ